jgi:hypothetical protein
MAASSVAWCSRASRILVSRAKELDKFGIGGKLEQMHLLTLSFSARVEF